jgi:hypothetical protein
MTLQDGCYSLKLECALRELGFVDIGWKCVAHAGLFFVQPYGLPDDPEGDLIGFSIIKSDQAIKLVNTAKKALDYCLV